MDVREITAEQVEALVNTFLSRLKPDDYPHAAINWGDLSCTEVKEFKDGSWYIVVQEASPSAWELRQDLNTYLDELGIKAELDIEW